VYPLALPPGALSAGLVMRFKDGGLKAVVLGVNARGLTTHARADDGNRRHI
jgi:hypothetical protein